MNTSNSRFCAILLLLLFSVQSTWATCGGGGGGGVGGMSGGSGGGAAPVVYHVPWKVRTPKDPAPSSGLVLYWFPASKEELQRSSLRESRVLTLYATQCISMELADQRVPNADKLLGDSKLPVSVVAEKCMFKKKANDAAKELKKLGAGAVGSIPEPPVFEPRKSALIERTMVRGLRAELNGRYMLAEK